MNIIITGASGFVGSNLSTYLQDHGNAVQKLSLRTANWQLNPADAVIHLAGKAHDTANTAAEKDYFDINTELTKKLFDRFLNSDIRTFIFFSSVKAAADTLDEQLTEDISPNPQTPYGKSKLEAEEYLLSKNLPENKRLFIIRPCMIHGPGNRGNLNLLYKVVSKGIPWPLAGFENQRSFISIDNLNFLMDKMLHADIPSGIYNIADDKPLSTNNLIKLISESSGKKARLWHIPNKLISAVAMLGDRLHLPLNTERLKKLKESYTVSNTKIKFALSIEKLPLSAEEGLKKTLKSFANS